MRDIVIAVVIIGFIPYILKRTHVGVMVWSWLAIMNPHRMTFGFAQTLPFSMIVAITTIISFVFSKQPKRFPLTPITAVLIIWVLWMSITTIFSLNPTEAWPYWLRVIKIQFMILLMMALVWDKEKLHMLVWVVTMSLAFFGIKGGLFAIAHGGNYMVLGPDESFISGNTEISLALTMVLPLMRYLQVSTTNKWISRGLMAGMLLTGLSIVASYSRGALVAGAAMAMLLWLKTKGTKKIGLAFMMTIAIVMILAFIPDKWFDKMATIKTYDQDASAQGRINAWWFAVNLAKSNPITGGGFKTFTHELFLRYAPNPTDVHDAHSIYFQVLGEQGYVGLFLFLLLGLLAWRTGSAVLRNCRDKPELRWAQDLAAMIQVSMVGYAVGGAFLGLAYFDVPYQLMAFLVILKVITEQAPSTQAEAVGSAPGKQTHLPFVRPRNIEYGQSDLLRTNQNAFDMGPKNQVK